MVLAGQIEEVARYCESDVLSTYRVWLVYELFRGSITVKELDWSEAQIRDFVATRKSANSLTCVGHWELQLLRPRIFRKGLGLRGMWVRGFSFGLTT